MRPTRKKTWLLVTGLLAGISGGCERAEAGGEADRGGSAEPGSAVAGAAAGDEVRVSPANGVVIPDEELVDQDGNAVRLPALLAGRAAAINFVFTTCTSICSPMTAVFARLARDLGDALDRDVRLVTISLDPATDTPERLAKYAARFDRRPGWTFLTGRPERVRRVLSALRGDAGPKEDHGAETLLGSARSDRWARVYGLAPAARLAAELRALGLAAPPAGEDR